MINRLSRAGWRRVRPRPRRAIVHIGIDKTGTKTIQNYLYGNRKDLLRKGILVPSLDSNLSVYLGVLFREKTPLLLPLFDARAEDESAIPLLKSEYRAALDKELAAKNWDTVVISAEGLCDSSQVAVERMKAWLEEFEIADIHVIAFVREPSDWTRSVTQQRLKEGVTLADLYENPRRPSWKRRFTPWLNCFGRANMTVIRFESARQDGLLKTFCSAAAIPAPRVEPQAANESMSMEAALILDHLNRVRPLFENGTPSRNRIGLRTQLVADLPGTPFVLPEEVRAGAIEATREEVAWLNETFGVPL